MTTETNTNTETFAYIGEPVSQPVPPAEDILVQTQEFPVVQPIVETVATDPKSWIGFRALATKTADYIDKIPAEIQGRIGLRETVRAVGVPLTLGAMALGITKATLLNIDKEDMPMHTQSSNDYNPANPNQIVQLPTVAATEAPSIAPAPKTTEAAPTTTPHQEQQEDQDPIVTAPVPTLAPVPVTTTKKAPPEVKKSPDIATTTAPNKPENPDPFTLPDPETPPPTGADDTNKVKNPIVIEKPTTAITTPENPVPLPAPAGQ